MTVEEMGVLIATQMRQQGFRKKKLTWYKNQEDVTIVFNIQKSQYSNDIWYYNYGIGINDFYPKQITDIQKCDICYRFEQALNHQIITADDLVRILQIWVDQYGSLEKLISQAHKGKLPAMTTKKCLEYLLNRYRNNGWTFFCAFGLDGVITLTESAPLVVIGMDPQPYSGGGEAYIECKHCCSLVPAGSVECPVCGGNVRGTVYSTIVTGGYDGTEILHNMTWEDYNNRDIVCNVCGHSIPLSQVPSPRMCPYCGYCLP